MGIKRLAGRLTARRIVQLSGLILFLASPGGTLLKLDPLLALSVPSVLLLLATVLWGRWFCGWLCPFGTYHGALARVFAKVPGSGRLSATPPRRQNLKYYFLALLLAASITGSGALGWFDPLCQLYRGLGVVQAIEVYQSLATSLPGAMKGWLNPPVSAASSTLASDPSRPVLWGSTLALVLFMAATAANYFRPRFWCVYLCPLGAMLGLAASRSGTELHLDAERCRSCHACSRVCRSGANPEHTEQWRASECFSCRSCQKSCPLNALDFRACGGPSLRR